MSEHEAPPRSPRSAVRAEGLGVPDPVTAGAGSSSPALYVLDALRLRPVGRRVLSVLSVLLFLLGAGMFAYPLATDLYATRVIQDGLEQQFETQELREQYEARELADSDPLTRIKIPALGVDALVVAGVTPEALRAGAGHYPETSLPGEPGNVAIAGHRTTYGKPFNRLDELPVGEEIVLVTPLATHTYRIVAHPEAAARPCPSGACWITDPYDWEVVSPEAEGSLLTLTTCHPKGSDRERLILRAELVSSEPLADHSTPEG